MKRYVVKQSDDKPYLGMPEEGYKDYEHALRMMLVSAQARYSHWIREYCYPYCEMVTIFAHVQFDEGTQIAAIFIRAGNSYGHLQARFKYSLREVEVEDTVLAPAVAEHANSN